MPWKTFQEEGKHCVYRVDEGGGKVKLLKCYSDKDKASAYQRALYASENKESIMPDNEKLAEYIVAVETVASSDIEDKSLEFKKLAAQFYIDECAECEEEEIVTEPTYPEGFKEKVLGIVRNFIGETEEEEEEEQKQSDFVVWKEKDGTMKWLARYSNKYRDDDNPPEIISSKSHERFVNFVDDGQFPLPVLEVWHLPGLRFGKATHVAYDDSGFALAAGVIDDSETAKETALWLSEQKDIAMSHGMPSSSIKRDADDPTIIVEHQTVEISVLPMWAAANKMTDFVILDDPTKEDYMAIPTEKRAAMETEWGASPELLDSLESSNAEAANAAEEAGKESKELETQEETANVETEETVAETTEETVEAETAAEAETDATEESTDTEETEAEAKETDPLDDAPTRREVVDFLAETIKPYLDRIAEVENGMKEVNDSVGLVAEALKELAQSDEEKIQKAVLETPGASMSSLLAERFTTIGKSANAVDGRSSLAKSKPAEEPPVGGEIGIPILNSLVRGEDIGGDYFTSQNE